MTKPHSPRRPSLRPSAPWILVGALLGLPACDPDPASVIGGMDGGRTGVDTGPRPDSPPIIIPGDDGGTVGRSDGGGIAIGGWRERILDADGNIDWEEWEYVANHYNEEEIVDYRFGPTAVDFGFPTNEDPELYGPDPEGLWRGGLDADLANRYCVTPDRLPRSEAEEAMLYDGGGGWQMSGQLLFSPDPSHPDYTPDFAFGSANMRAWDAAMARQNIGGELVTRGLCMRLRAEWYGDWWNRNNISAPVTPSTSGVVSAVPGTPLPPIATARGEMQTSVTGFLAFRNGIIAAAGTGNDGYDFSGVAAPFTQLPEGLVPTALASTPGNEFVFVTVWDVAARRSAVAVIAAGVSDEPATVPAGFGTHSWPSVQSLKYLGLVELPFAAPMAISVTHGSPVDNLRGTRVVEEGARLSDQSQRDAYRAIPWNSARDEDRFRQIAQAGFALVSSRAENRVAVIDLRPLFAFYRDMYLTTQENWEATRPANQGPGDREWPYTFAGEPSQVPEVLAVLEVPQPTAVYATQAATSTNVRAPDGNESAGFGYGVIGSLDGTVRLFDLRSVADPTMTPAVPTSPTVTLRVGPNPTHITSPIKGDGRTDDLFIVSRGGRAIHVFDYRLNPIDVLRDGRMEDPVWVTIGPNGAGYGGSGSDYALSARVLTVLDRDGQQVIDYGMAIGGRSDAALDATPLDAEEWDFFDPDGNRVRFLHGYSNPLPGRPFMFTMDEVI